MPSTSRSQQRLFSMAYAVRTGKLKRSDVHQSVLDIVDGDMTDEEIKHFTVLKECFTDLSSYIRESILSTTNSGKEVYMDHWIHKNIPNLLSTLKTYDVKHINNRFDFILQKNDALILSEIDYPSWFCLGNINRPIKFEDNSLNKLNDTQLPLSAESIYIDGKCRVIKDKTFNILALNSDNKFLTPVFHIIEHQGFFKSIKNLTVNFNSMNAHLNTVDFSGTELSFASVNEIHSDEARILSLSDTPAGDKICDIIDKSHDKNKGNDITDLMRSKFKTMTDNMPKLKSIEAGKYVLTHMNDVWTYAKM